MIIVAIIEVGTLFVYPRYVERKEAHNQAIENEVRSKAENDAKCMFVEDIDKYIESKTTGSTYIVEYDENELKVSVCAYNISTDKTMTVEQLKEHFQNNDEDYTTYCSWYLNSIRANQRDRYREAVNYALILKNKSSVPFATDIELEQAIQHVNRAIEETDAHELNQIDLEKIVDWLNVNNV